MPPEAGVEGLDTEEEANDKYIADEDPASEESAAVEPSTPFVDKTVAASVPPTPGTVVTPPVGAPATPQAAAAGSFGALQEGVAAATDKANAIQEESGVEADRLAAQKQDEDDIRVQRELEAQAQKDSRDEYLAKKDAADEKVRDFKFHDYYDDPKHQSAVLDKFSVFLGGLGNLGGQAPGAPNRALDTVEGKIRADHDEQLSYLNSAKYFADKQAEGVTDLLKQQASDRQQAELEYANKKLATADKFAELAQTARGKQNYDAAMIEVAKLKKSAYDDQQKVFSEIAQQKLEDAKAQHQLRLANRGRGTGGGGGSSLDAAQAKTAAEIEALKQTKPEGAGVSYAEMSAIALKNKLPLQAKAGRPSLAGIIAGEAKGASVTSAETRTAERLNQLKLTGPNGEDLGTAHNLNDAKAAAKSNSSFQQISERMKALIDDVEKNGDRVLTPDDVQRRNSLGAKVLAAARVYNGLGATDASQHLESLINGALGTPGQGFFIGANLGVLKDNLREAEESNKARLSIYTRQGFPKTEAGQPTAAQIAGIARLRAIGAVVNP